MRQTEHRVSKVFGIGWAKTGTTTLGQCFRTLGFTHQGQNLSLVDDVERGELTRILRIASASETFEDWPWILLFRELDRAFPGSRFVLTIRDPERWLKSYRAMLSAENSPSVDIIRFRTFIYGVDVRYASDDQLLHRYSMHNRDVMEYFRGRLDDLLVVDWECGHEWHELCSFLYCPIPSEPFPHLNQRNSCF